MELIKVFIITKENGEKHIQDAERLAEEFQKYPRLEKVNKVYKERERERDQKENAWGAVEQI